MQIDRQNYLLFPRDNAPTATGNESAPGAAAHAAGQPLSRVPAPQASDVGVAHAASTVLNIQWPDDPATARNRNEAAVYAPARKAVGHDDDADAADQAQAHQRALERSNGVFTRLTVSPDGVLVAKPQTSAETKQPDFVALAVSAMREFSDEAERVKAAQPAPAEAPPSATGWGKLKDLQHQFAARFKALA